jgi:uncharacterized membrane protein
MLPIQFWHQMSIKAAEDDMSMSWSQGSEAHHRSLIKAITWRATGSVDTFLITLLVTGRLSFAGSVAGIEVITKIMLYYMHERIWLMIPWGRVRRGMN